MIVLFPALLISAGVSFAGPFDVQVNESMVGLKDPAARTRYRSAERLAADGSFHVRTPANRLMHFQVLDSDRRVVGKQLTWIYTAGGETKSCVGCHEPTHATAAAFDPLAAHQAPLDFTPDGEEFTYRAKAWFKGTLPMAIEERTRTVRSVSLIGQ